MRKYEALRNINLATRRPRRVDNYERARAPSGLARINAPRRGYCPDRDGAALWATSDGLTSFHLLSTNIELNRSGLERI